MMANGSIIHIINKAKCIYFNYYDLALSVSANEQKLNWKESEEDWKWGKEAERQVLVIAL